MSLHRRIITWNVNGIRAIQRKGALANLLSDQSPDVLMLQETKAHEVQLQPPLIDHPDYWQFYHSATKRGYSGTAIWLRRGEFERPQIHRGMDDYQDLEGRVIRADIGEISLISIYFPNGGKSAEAWQEKIVFYEKFLKYVDGLRDLGRVVVWGGDINCAHQPIDLARPNENKNSIGFLPEERDWVSKVIAHHWVDIFRNQHPTKVSYSWWHQLTKARERNVGWRIDYLFASQEFLIKVGMIRYLDQHYGSDHCPLLLECDL